MFLLYLLVPACTATSPFRIDRVVFNITQQHHIPSHPFTGEEVCVSVCGWPSLLQATALSHRDGPDGVGERGEERGGESRREGVTEGERVFCS